MPKFKGVQINTVKPVNKDKTKPALNWCVGLPGKQVSVFYRRRGQKFGEHFHKGEDLSRKPERLLLVKGKMRYSAINLQGQKMEAIVMSGQEIIVEPFVFHSVKALADVIFLEYRATIFDPKKDDIYRWDEFIKYLK